MPNINKQYQNLASKGRYGDTMLAHINPQEAGLLRSMGGAGTINPRTGLPEFYGYSQMKALGLIPEPYQAPFGSYDMRGAPPERPAPFDRKFADVQGSGKGMQRITGYTLPNEQTYQGIPLVAKYDEQGNFRFLTLKEGNYLSPDPSRPNIQSVPRFNAQGEVIDLGIVDTNNQNDGGFFSSIGELAKEFGPMILAGIGANYLAGSGLFTGGAGAAAGGATAADIAASNALAAANTAGYAGTELAATAGAELLAGGATAADIAASNALAGLEAGSGTGLLSSGTGLTTGGSGLGLTSEGGLGLTTGSAGAGSIGAGLGTELAAINTGIGAGVAAGGIGAGSSAAVGGGMTPVDYSLGSAAAGAGATVGTGAASSILSSLASATGIPLETLNKLAPSVIQGLIGAGGSYLQSEQAKEAAKTQADAQIRAAQIAADAARFRPVGVTTRFGSSNFQTDAQGNVIGAGYTPSAEITGYQDRLKVLANQGLTDAEGARAAYQPLTGAAQSLFGLGQNYLNSNLGQPLTDMSRTYMQSQAGQPLTSMGQTYMASQVGQPVTSLGQQYMQSQAGQPLTQLGQEYIASQAGQPITSMGQRYMQSQAGQPLTQLGQQYIASDVGQPLTSLGQQYLQKSPDQIAADYIAKQQALLNPSRQNELAQLQNRLFQQGRGGAATAQGGNLGATSPELQAYYNALAQSDLQLAANARQAGQQETQFGADLYARGLGLTSGRQVQGADLYQSGTGLTRQEQIAGADLYRTGTGLTQAQQLAGANLYQSGRGLTREEQIAGANLYGQGTGLTQSQQLAGANLYGQGTALTQAQQLAGADLYRLGTGLTQQGQQFGAGLFGTGADLQNRFYSGQAAAYSPFATAMDTSSGLERLAQQPLDLSTAIGSRVSTANADVGRLTGQGIINAANTMAPANTYSGTGNLLSGVANSPVFNNAVGKLFGQTPPQVRNIYTGELVDATSVPPTSFRRDPVTGQYIPVP